MDFLKFLKGGRSSGSTATVDSERTVRRSTGLSEMAKSLARLDQQSVLDMGPTSSANISFFTSMGQRTYNEDVLLASRDSQFRIEAESGPTVDVDRFLAENLAFEPERFDAVLLWDTPDYLPEALVKPVVLRIHSIMKPGALLLAFFHTRDAGPDAPYQRYHITSPDTIELQRVFASSSRNEVNGRNAYFRLQRVFNNRHIENLFQEFGSIKFFLGRDNIREVLVVR